MIFLQVLILYRDIPTGLFSIRIPSKIKYFILSQINKSAQHSITTILFSYQHRAPKSLIYNKGQMIEVIKFRILLLIYWCQGKYANLLLYTVSVSNFPVTYHWVTGTFIEHLNLKIFILYFTLISPCGLLKISILYNISSR